MFTSINTLQKRLAEVGKIKIGGKGEERTSRNGNKFRMPEKYDHFVITTNHRDADGKLIPDAEIMKQLGDKPRELDVFLLFDDIELNFPHKLSYYEGKNEICSGDGETALRVDSNGEKQSCECPCELLKARKCKPSGRLSVILANAPTAGGVYVFRTHGWNSVQNIKFAMEFVQSFTGGILAGIPFKLKIHPKTAETDKGQATVYMVTLEYAGSVDDLMQKAVAIAQNRAQSQIGIARMQALAEVRLKALKAGDLGDDETDIMEEYYPEQQEGYEDLPDGYEPVEQSDLNDKGVPNSTKIIDGVTYVYNAARGGYQPPTEAEQKNGNSGKSNLKPGKGYTVTKSGKLVESGKPARPAPEIVEAVEVEEKPKEENDVSKLW